MILPSGLLVSFLHETGWWHGQCFPYLQSLSQAHHMNFLVVDDNRLLNRFLTTYLRSKGHSCSSLTDSSKVLSWLDLNPCDAIILDIGMPKIDGISLISMIREKFAVLPIVMFTGLGYDEEAMQAARKAGANGYVSKGLGPSEIYSALMRVLSQMQAAASAPEKTGQAA
jgi:two-component system OmpR family response regulator